MTDDALLLTFQALNPDEAAGFVSLVGMILPHRQPELAGARTATALSLDSQMVTNLGLRAIVRGGLTDLDRAALAAHKQTFATISDDERLAILTAQEGSAFFQTVVHTVKYDFYNRHIVWKVLGYPDLGNDSGYIHQGFDVLEIGSTRG